MLLNRIGAAATNAIASRRRLMIQGQSQVQSQSTPSLSWNMNSLNQSRSYVLSSLEKKKKENTRNNQEKNHHNNNKIVFPSAPTTMFAAALATAAASMTMITAPESTSLKNNSNGYNNNNKYKNKNDDNYKIDCHDLDDCSLTNDSSTMPFKKRTITGTATKTTTTTNSEKTRTSLWNHSSAFLSTTKTMCESKLMTKGSILVEVLDSKTVTATTIPTTNEPTPSSSSSSSTTPSTSFQVMAALESKDELQRIRMAQILHDLHELAHQSNSSNNNQNAEQLKRQGTMGRLYKYVRKLTTLRRSNNVQNRTNGTPPSNKNTSAVPNTKSTDDFTSWTDQELWSSFDFAPKFLHDQTDNTNNHSDDTRNDVSPLHMINPLTPELAQRMISALFAGRCTIDMDVLLSLLETSCNVLKRDDTLISLQQEKEYAPNKSTITTTTTGTSIPITTNATTPNKVQDTQVQQQQVQDKRRQVIVVGDLHGSLASLQHVMELIGDIGPTTANQTTIVFNGDFVDRGNESLEVMAILLLLKIAYPDHVYLLRGNHEDVLVSSAYGFHDEVIDKFGYENSQEIWDAFNAVFCALPICLVTDTAAILHGGIPSRDFTLDDIKNITTEQRCAVRSLMDPKSDVDRLIQGLLWSDPSSKRNGIHHNTTRSIGVFYGPDIVASFLKHHDLKYLIRGHEVAEKGATILECDNDGRQVVTIFSHSEYPNGEGSNLGAFVSLDPDGDYELVRFSRNTKFKHHHKNGVGGDDYAHLNNADPYVHTLKSLISSHKNKLAKAFADVAPCGTATLSQWTAIMAKILELPDVPWLVLLPSLVPEINDPSELSHGTIDWRAFLALYVSGSVDGAAAAVVGEDGNSNNRNNNTSSQDNNIGLEIMHANHRMLMTVYKFLDFDGDGTINKNEFIKGIELLNKRLPQDRQLNDAKTLFESIDVDGTGEIDFEEFEQVFKFM